MHCIIYYSLLEVLKWLMSDIECTSCFFIHAKACDVCSNLSSGKLYNRRNFLSISSHCQCCTTACAPWCSNGSSSSNKWVLSNGLCTSGSGYKEHLPRAFVKLIACFDNHACKSLWCGYNLSSGKWRIFLTIVELSLAPLSCCTSASAPSQNLPDVTSWYCPIVYAHCQVFLV